MNKALDITQRNCPRDLEWDTRYDTPKVIQLTVISGVRITWNPDDNRFYVETTLCNTHGDWETAHTFGGNRKGWHNALNRARNYHEYA